MEAVRNLEDVAIVIRPEKDNVAVVTADFLEKGTTLGYSGESLTISGRVLRGQSFAIKKVGEGEPYVTLRSHRPRVTCGRARRPHQRKQPRGPSAQAGGPLPRQSGTARSRSRPGRPYLR